MPMLQYLGDESVFEHAIGTCQQQWPPLLLRLS